MSTSAHVADSRTALLRRPGLRRSRPRSRRRHRRAEGRTADSGARLVREDRVRVVAAHRASARSSSRARRSTLLAAIEERTDASSPSSEAAARHGRRLLHAGGVGAQQAAPSRSPSGRGSRAVELDTDHAGARARRRLGGAPRRVDDARGARPARPRGAQRARRSARGTRAVRGRWVTPEVAARIEPGLIEVDGRWVTADEAQRLTGLEMAAGGCPRPRQRHAPTRPPSPARPAFPLEVIASSDALVAGPFPRE